mmetsp:Transcript_8850/g.19124  ORF Transcript_8850/g.19124 Transcript_8850/m.19124 type:complete len:263 (+) Transcript_8850:122-910(+)|eukprot:CAMPEP_0168191556 /NCGR_PEP_ID=MMETSP0139_2-20121125/17581_1 /TAXON_ID=44445 /ORGANISM="Pseudo-nitzschia australis, Strain 10249 10 AB" /LENGTH=262 /DNA_ID=CAMNT_0008114743 /DNA_START=44 /DNA_END=835 /DNA_ORIENTATION=+
MSTRALLVSLTFALCGLAPIAEGRLFETARSTNNSNDIPIENEDRFESETDTDTRPVSMDSATTKFIKFVESSKNESMCDHIDPDELPGECSCTEPSPFSLVIECNKVFNSTYFNDTIGMKIDLDPCNENGAKVSFDVTEKEHGVDFPIAGVRAGESKNIPIPGLATIVPGVGNVGMDVAVLIAGNPDRLRLKIGLNACAQLSTDHQLCASSIPGLSTILPWWVLKGTYSFGDICGATVAAGGDDGTSNSGGIEENTAVATE